MHDSDQLPVSSNSLMNQLQQSLDQLDTLQSLELQRLRVMLDRRQAESHSEPPTLSMEDAIGRERTADFVVRRSRAA